MEKGNTVFYHNHIQSNIAKLQQRKDRFINHRIQFLKQYCLPIQEKINRVRTDIQKYKDMRDQQEEIIQTEPEIKQLKTEVSNYQHTQQYFHQKVDQYEQQVLEYEQYNRNLKKQLLVYRKGIKNHTGDQHFQLPYLSHPKNKHHPDELTGNRSIHSKSIALPIINHLKNHHQTENSLTSSKARHHNKIVNISQKIQRFRSYPSVQQEKLNQSEACIKQEPQSESQAQVKEKKRSQELRSRITEFNNTETLFHDCFQVKKNSVQKSVSQLQSKLIANREEFLNTCHAIGSKEEKIEFEEFRKLSSDQILTLFISFVWLNKKINAQFTAKRKLIMDFIGKLPKLDQR